MAVPYVEIDLIIEPVEPGREILLAHLGQYGFESFKDTERGLLAYIPESDLQVGWTDTIAILETLNFRVSYRQKRIEPENWNAQWESNFEPIVVDDLCQVRAPFHTSDDLPYEILIEPKMSFGTGHHETTHMMLSFILENDFDGKRVLDMGCGTSVLGILAAMRGASAVIGVDIDPWCVENSQENIEANQINEMKALQGGADVLSDLGYFDSILANINRNILLSDMEQYLRVLRRPHGQLFLSGFYLQDLDVLKKACNKHDMEFIEHKERNNWVAAKFVFL
ncbi:50S ribosomal protein L11 methyltransferase [Aureitalea marina]|uniref:Ribosomal protein L11 methyltransferase n=1 Tax=Aureitalea marina TaxID=930804 RepID=A0A2S7KMD7_9FLAO|nr:50S ribosomal protein L11 methyltransferase [Aureitalea marina]PQB03794.1 ribosomal protein L11 methyltransferase [Aureitalea marina]